MRTTRKGLFLLAALALLPLPSTAQKFFPDDPLNEDLPPAPTRDVNNRALSDLWSMFENLFAKPGERHPGHGVIPAQAINTMGEVLDGPWFVNRHWKKRMTADELTAGPGNDDPPSVARPWQVLTVKRYDVRPGMFIADADNQVYLLHFDPPGRLELATAASMVASRVYYALGYWVPQNYIVYFGRSQLSASREGEDINAVGKAKKLLEDDIDLFLAKVAVDPRRGYRAVATKVPPGQPVGPYSFYGMRTDDPNDIYAHEHRRDQRGLFVYSAWLANNWIRPLATFDFLVEENGLSFIRHYIVDFFSSLGSGFENVKEPREGHETWFDWNESVRNFIGFGFFYSPRWQRADYPGVRSVGRLEYEVFNPEDWMPNTHLASLANHLPDDDLWASRNIMSFTDDDIRALVKAGQYSDRRAEEWIAKCLIERRNKIGRAFFSKVLPLDDFRVEDAELKFEHLAVRYGLEPEPSYRIQWTVFNNFSREHTPIPGASNRRLPPEILRADAGAYFAARVSTGEYGKSLDVFVRKEEAAIRVVGVDRNWAGKVVAERSSRKQGRRSRYEDLDGKRKELFDLFTKEYNEKTGFHITPEDYFESLSISERTTFDAVTHALMKTELTDKDGASFGTALDLVTGINRIAGQYYGRQGDEQFRVYVRLREGAKEMLDKSQQYFRERDNAVYHVGYPVNFRQTGKVPTTQISMAEDGSGADIDVDYRSSKMPEAMWNGHLSSANSDVRAGNNYQRHNNRWSGLVAWWQRIFGDLPPEEPADAATLLARTPPPANVMPMPPNRASGQDIPQLEDAVLEFLGDWLVRQNTAEALEFVSDEALPCVGLVPNQAAITKATRKAMRQLLASVADRLGDAESLSYLIEAVRPWGPNVHNLGHRFAAEFSLVEVSDSLGESFLCRNREGRFQPGTRGEPRFGTYFGAIFRAKNPIMEQGALGLLWKKEGGRWQIVSYDVFGE
jgi:hypothetical protein